MGCQTLAGDKPARIVNPDDASRAALQKVVNAAMHTDVTLADDALTQSSILTIERNPPRTMSNPNPQGRIMEAPFRFRLVTNSGECVLIDDRDQTRHVLSATRCMAE
ncbi:MAG: hypothetical protein ACR2Q3_15365 [Woeseiaceae bacterium]